MVHKGTSSSYRSVNAFGFNLARFSSVFQAPLHLRSTLCYIYFKKFAYILLFKDLLVSWAWWDWPLTWLTIVLLCYLLYCLYYWCGSPLTSTWPHLRCDIVLQCYDAVVWVVWPVKSSPKWLIMCLVRRPTLLYHTIQLWTCSEFCSCIKDCCILDCCTVYC